MPLADPGLEDFIRTCKRVDNRRDAEGPAADHHRRSREKLAGRWLVCTGIQPEGTAGDQFSAFRQPWMLGEQRD
jgi:hypothetical protein